MSATILVDDLDTYISQYGTQGAIQRLQFIASKTENKALKIDAGKHCLDMIKRTTNAKAYGEVHASLKVLTEGSDAVAPNFDSVWVEATQKQSTILKDLYEQDLHAAKVQQAKDQIRTAHTQLINHCIEQGEFSLALKYVSTSREWSMEAAHIFQTCMTFIRLSALLRQYTDIQTFTSKAQHTQGKEQGGQSMIHAAYGLYYMTSGKFKDAALSFVQVRQQDLTGPFLDVLCPQDIALYGVLCALASLDRNEVQAKLLDSSSFRECLDLVPQVRDLTLDFCSCKYAACLSSLEQMKEALALDLHLHEQVSELCQQIRSKGIVQYFAPFMSVSLHSMAAAFNTDVDGMQAEVARLVSKGQLDAKIDSHKKILYMRHANQRMAAYQNTMRVSEDFLNTTQALILRMNVLKHDFGIHLARQKK